MRRLLAPLMFVVLIAAACSSSDGGADTTTSTTQAGDGSTTSMALTVPPELADHDIDLVPVGDRLMLLAVANTSDLRAQGLMGVTDLGDLDGMVFSWDQPTTGGFWMKDTLIPLDIVWFDEDGRYVGSASMVPCEEDPCVTYPPPGNASFKYAIEANPGDLDWVDESTEIGYGE